MAAPRIDTSPLASLLQRQGAQEAAGRRQSWETLGQLPGATIGAFRAEEDRQREMRYRENQDRYYETMRQAQQSRIDTEARMTQAGQVFTGLRKQYGDDETQIGEIVMSPDGDYGPEVVSEYETWRDASRERDIQDRTLAIQEIEAQGILYSKSASELSALVDKEGELVPGEYRQVRDRLYGEAIEMGIPEARALQLLPEDYDKDVIEGTIRLGQSEADRASRIMLMHDRKSKTQGYTLPIEPIKRMEMQQKFIEAGLSELAVVDDRGDLDRLIERWERGTEFGKPTMPPEIRELFADLTDTSTFNAAQWSDRVRKEKAKHMDPEQLDLEDQYMALPFGSDEAKDFLMKWEAMTESKRQKTPGGGSSGGEILTYGQGLTTAQAESAWDTFYEGQESDDATRIIERRTTAKLLEYAPVDTELQQEDSPEGLAAREQRNQLQGRIRQDERRKFVGEKVNELRSRLNLPSSEQEWDLRDAARQMYVQDQASREWHDSQDPNVVAVLQRDGTVKWESDRDYPPTQLIDAYIESMDEAELRSLVPNLPRGLAFEDLYKIRKLSNINWLSPGGRRPTGRGVFPTFTEEAYLTAGEEIPEYQRRE